MFYNCKSLTTAPKLPATTLADGCYSEMLSGCTSLTKAPELPATTLTAGCYSNMFDGCTSLTKAPELPATRLANICYYGMFSDCKSLIAYLREAIKRKEELTKLIPDLQSLVDFRNTMPVMEKVITRDDIIASWDIKQLNHYLTLQTKCAVFGNAVHSNALNAARKQAYYAKENPCSYTGSGRDTVIIQKTVTVDMLEIDNTFFEIQSQHRKLQAELNGIEASIEDTISKDYTVKSNKYNAEMSDYRTQLAILNQQNNEHLISERDKIKNLKIVIPHNLKDIYSIVNSF